MARWKGKSKGNTAGYKIFVFLIKTTGVSGAYLLLRFVSFYYLLFSPKTSKPIIGFYMNKLNFTSGKARRMLLKNYYLLGQSIIDKVAIMSGLNPEFTFDFDGEHHLREMVKAGKGGLLLSGHLGNWEAAGHLLKRLNTTVHIVMYDGEDADIKKYMDEVTGNKTFKIIYIKKDLSHIYEISDALSRNGIVCMHADRFLPGNKTVVCNFFSEEPQFPEGPFLLALKLKVPVVYVFAFKENNKHYHFYSTELKHFSSQKDDTIQMIANDYTNHLESMTRKYPEHWFNYYNFWKKAS